MVERGGWRVRILRLWLPLGLYMLFTLFPFYWMAVTSLKPNSELYNRKIMPLIVYHPTLKHYVDLLTETNLIDKTYLIAKILRFTGTVITVAAAIGAFVYARQGEEIVSEINL